MKLSFSRQSKPSATKSRPSQTLSDDQPSTGETLPQFVSEFDPSKTLISASNQPAIIPPIQNEWRPHKKMKNLDLPPLQSNNALEFEIEPSQKDEESMSYGLNLRNSDGKSSGGGGGDSIEILMSRKYKSDLERMPEAQDVEDYGDMPVEGYGAALLGGYGWREGMGMGIGRNAKSDVKVVEYKRRTAKEGIGFMADHPPVVAAVSKGGDERKGGDVRVGVGKEVRVLSGEEMGVKGKVVEVLDGGFVVLKVDRREEEMTVRADEVAEVGGLEEEKCRRKLKELRISGDHSRSRSRDDRGEKKKKERSKERERNVEEFKEVRREERKRSKGRETREVQREERVLWLKSHIRVRIISKDFKGGKFYLKKGVVVDVIGPGLCDLTMDEGREIVQGVDQDILETALPRRGGRVVVLFGKHKGVYGSLVEKDSEKETGIVQDADSQEMIRVQLDQIAEYIGDPSYLGY